MIGGGHDNLVTGNLIIDCPRGIHLDDRGVYRGYNRNNLTLTRQLRKVRHTSPPWSERYPEMREPAGCSTRNGRPEPRSPAMS